MDEGAPAQHIREARPGGKTNKERWAKCDMRNTLSTTRSCTVHYGACAVDEALERITTILSSDFDTAGDRHTWLPGAISQGGICLLHPWKHRATISTEIFTIR